MTPSTILLRARELSRALERLPSHDLAVLVALFVRADPSNGLARFSLEDLAIQLAVQPERIGYSLDRLARHDFLERLEVHGDIELLALGPVLIPRGTTPLNLPLEPL